MSMLTEREAESLERAGKLGRFIRTHRCPECRGEGVMLSYGVHDMGGDLCWHCGGSGRLAVYTNTPAQSAPAASDDGQEG